MFKKCKISNSKMLVIMAGIFLSSCIKNNSNEIENNYFDISGFIKSEIKILNDEKFSAEKYLITESDTQKLDLTNVNWESELNPFIKSDINKPAWRTSYSIDSVFKNNELSSIRYSALESKLPIQQIQIHFKQNKPSQIYIENSNQNYVYNSAQILTYYSEKNYSIEGEQDIKLGNDLHYKIVVNFKK